MRRILRQLIPESVQDRYRKYKKARRLELYKGDNVICPVCNSQLSRFEPYNGRLNARCIGCDSLERHRLLWVYIREKTSLLQNNKRIRMLHFAPESTFYEMFSEIESLDYTPCDLYVEKYRNYKKTKLQTVDITNIPFDDNRFDTILCNHVLEHITDDTKAMGELFRVMKPGGWGIFQVPIDYALETTYEDFSITSPEGRRKAFGLEDHVRWYGRDYKKKLESVGFTVKEDHYIETFSSEDIARYGFDASELVYYCNK